MSTDKQTYHLKHRCPKCGELLHFRRTEKKELFCEKCGHIDTYIFDASEVFFTVQKDRRKEKRSIGKKILAGYQRSPILIRKNYWLVYDLGYLGKIFFENETKEYDFLDEAEELLNFKSIDQLIEYLCDSASNKSIERDGAKKSCPTP